jgi:serine/threonine-protein kinase
VGTKARNEEPLIGQVIGGRYEVVRLVGKGGMGSVYEVRNTRLGRSFAMKTLTSEAAANPRTLQRFRQEADVIARLEHPNIVAVIDWETLDDGSPAMVMEYLRGDDLSKRIAAGPVAWPALARVADEMLAALSIAHAHGVVHRDLKPENVLLATDDAGGERVKLLDFGVSKVRDSKSFVTTEDTMIGTPSYMSPEQADGRMSDIGAHSDVWAIGAILHEMATGSVAFSAPSVPSILYRICHGSPGSLVEQRPDAPPAFVELVAATLAREIDHRITDAAALRVRLRDALRDVPGVHFAEPLPAPGTPPTVVRPASEEAITVHAPSMQAPTPSMISRRSLAPVAVVIVGLATAVVVTAIVLATRGRPATSTAAVARPTGEAHGTADASVTVVGAPSVEPASATSAESPREPVHDQPHVPAKVVPAARAQATKANAGQSAAAVVAPAVAPPSRVDPPAVAPTRKPCAKDDVECLYGDGT